MINAVQNTYSNNVNFGNKSIINGINPLVVGARKGATNLQEVVSKFADENHINSKLKVADNVNTASAIGNLTLLGKYLTDGQIQEAYVYISLALTNGILFKALYSAFDQKIQKLAKEMLYKNFTKAEIEVAKNLLIEQKAGLVYKVVNGVKKMFSASKPNNLS